MYKTRYQPQKYVHIAKTTGNGLVLIKTAIMLMTCLKSQKML